MGPTSTDGSTAPITGGAVDLFWIPLGAGAHVVRISGRVFEAVAARVHRRPVGELYHAALVVWGPDGRWIVEQTPVPDGDGAVRGVVASGPVGTRWIGRWRLFRYEVRRWRGGQIPDLDLAVGGPRRLTDDPDVARQVLDVVPSIPTPTWGRDELQAGEMWSSNSVISWVLASGGVDLDQVAPPAGGRAPGWDAGIAVSLRRR